MRHLIGAANIFIEGSTINADTWSTDIAQSRVSLSDMTRRSGNLQRIPDYNGVSLSRAWPGTAFDYAGWMNHSFFILSVWNPVDNDPFDPSEQVFAKVYTGGAASGSNPVSGSATWRGAVVGVDASENASKGNPIVGDATIRIGSFTSPAVDVSFTSLIDQRANVRRSDMYWHGLAVRNGAFDHNGDLRVGVAFADRGNAFNSLTGRFYGPNHEEVGGVFIRDEIAGAFGARR